mmetsp:Transcript_142948/g.252387  ORF Transcript_142948/g.252387 Transcript_142948/m.252387 type:complete len:83 (-) Transcript_142948:13-261(-)
MYWMHSSKIFVVSVLYSQVVWVNASEISARLRSLRKKVFAAPPSRHCHEQQASEARMHTFTKGNRGHRRLARANSEKETHRA